jgi:hypothetical protein
MSPNGKKQPLASDDQAGKTSWITLSSRMARGRLRTGFCGDYVSQQRAKGLHLRGIQRQALLHVPTEAAAPGVFHQLQEGTAVLGRAAEHLNTSPRRLTGQIAEVPGVFWGLSSEHLGCVLQV